MGMTFYNLTMEDLCDLMCGTPEEDYEGEKCGTFEEDYEEDYEGEK